MAANQVTVATPGPAGAIGMTYEGLWVDGSVYQVRDCVRFTDANLYFCNVQHTASSSNTPILDSDKWSLFINASDAFQWATKAKHTQITDSLSNTGYSALHQAAKAQDWAVLTTDAVTNDANASDVGYSAKAWAIGGTEVTTTASRGAAKEWATTTGGQVDTAEYSAKEYAQGSVLAAGGSSKNWAQLATTPSTTATDASAKEWATGVSTHKNEGSSKDWAVYTAGDVRGAASGSMSSKEWAVGTQGRGVAGEGSAKDWATRTTATVDNADYSAKEFAIGTTASTGGSAKDWATYTAADVRGAGSGDMSAKEWAVGVLGRGIAGEGSSKDWAIRTGAIVDNAEYSAKEYSQGSFLAAGGSAKNWAQLATTPTTTATDASAKEWATGVSTHKNEGSAKDWAVYTSGDVRGASAGSMSSKEWAVGIQGRGVASEGSSKDWATRTAATVDDAEYSAKEYATGTTVAVGSSKEWATVTGSAVASSEFSAKEYAQGTAATGGSAKEWAQDTSAAVDTTFSAKEYAQGTQASTGGSAKNWATQTGADVTGASSGDMSSKEWALGTLGRGVASEGSSKDWSTYTSGTVDNAEFSAKEYALGTQASTGGSSKSWAQDTDQVNGAGTNDRSAKNWAQGASMTGATLGGSAKDWAQTAEDSQVNGSEYSAKHYSAKAATSASSAEAVAVSMAIALG